MSEATCGLHTAGQVPDVASLIRATLALLSDPQCQTATHPLVTAASPAMTTRNCIAAMRFASGSASRKLASNGREAMSLLPKCLCSPKREAERRTAHHGCRASVGRRGRGPINKRTARLSALLRGHAPGFLPTRPGPRFLEPPDANGRTLSGTSAASTSQSGTRRTG
jgi:hypothetical protein